MIKQENKFHFYQALFPIYIMFSAAMAGRNNLEEIHFNNSDLKNWSFHRRFPLLSLIPKRQPDVNGGTFDTKTGVFCYSRDECEPTKWDGVCSNGTRQSPVELTANTSKVIELSTLEFGQNYYQTQKSFFIANNGHTLIVQMREDGSSRYGFSHLDLGFEYKFSQMHFHWAQKGTDGSEHTLEGYRLPLELHLVHHKKTFETLQKSLESTDPSAVGVLGIFLKIGRHNKALESIVKAASQVKLTKPGQLYFYDGTIQLYSLLPEKKRNFRYYGSLTTPPCVELVLWTVFPSQVEISAEQADVFRQIQLDHDGGRGSENYRPVQPLNKRKVEYFRTWRN